MHTASTIACPGCGYENECGALSCNLCGSLLERPGDASGSRRMAPPPLPLEPHEPAVQTDRDRVFGLPAAPIYLLGGALIAPVFAATPLLRMAGWFLRSLFHESGHTLVAWFFGMPAFPAIRLDGHAASVHQGQVLILTLILWAGLGYLCWQLRRRRAAMVLLGAAALLYPLLAFSGAKELLHLAAGHCGELAVACIFFWRALAGGFTSSRAERLLYAVLAWYLVGSNVDLCWGLIHSAASRDWYAMNGSFGLTNDYIRMARDVLGWQLQSVAALMLVISCLPLPLAVLIRRWLPEW